MYGASAKGSTLLNYFKIGSETIDFVVDRNTHKQGKFMSGIRVPIFGVEKLLEDQPDYVVILAWNFKDEIMSQMRAYSDAGGRIFFDRFS